MKKVKFGTDGIRGIYGKELTDDTAYRLGAYLARKGKVLLARDNRSSSPLLAAAFLGGVASVGGDCLAIGICTTPALYYIFTQSDARFAVMITASHNPPVYNGLKVFDRGGKLGKAEREAIEKDLSREDTAVTYAALREDTSAQEKYRAFFTRAVGDLTGVRAIVDYACGAGNVFSDLLSSLGAEILSLGTDMRGEMINEGCGALHPEALIKKTLSSQADLGFALDGDGDRIVAVSGEGDLLDGDALVYLLARKKKREGTLPKDRVAMTVMTNGGVVRSLAELSVGVTLTEVGDAAVTAVMREEGLALGGEQSGHIVLGDHMMTGDGLLVGGMLLRMIKSGEFVGKPKELKIYPQFLYNVPVRDKAVVRSQGVRECITRLEKSMEGGRIFVRASGTENVVRILTESPNAERAERAALAIAQEIEKRDADL